MDRSTVDKILDAQERFYRDPEYGALWRELQDRNRDFQRVMDELSPQQQDVMVDYMGLLHEMYRKLLRYAVEKTES